MTRTISDIRRETEAIAAARLAWIVELSSLATEYQRRDFSRADDASPNVAVHHHLFDLELDPTAGIWAVDESHAHEIATQLQAILRHLLSDEDLVVSISRDPLCGVRS